VGALLRRELRLPQQLRQAAGVHRGGEREFDASGA
jgi:hypothetical protein